MDGDKDFVLKNDSKHESQFYFLNILDWTSDLSKKVEFKIGSCEVKWKMTVSFSDRGYVNIGIQGENLGLHTGILAFEKPRGKLYNYGIPVIDNTRILITKDDKAMKYVRCHTDYFFRNGNKFSGKITVSNCDCMSKLKKEKLLDENFIQFQTDIHTQWKDNLSSDIKIKVGKTCFNAHKFILRARSPVFAKMLEHDMKERKDNCITVADTSDIIMKNFMSFLYSGSLEDDSFGTVIGLYSLADKYEVASLRKTCRSLLISEMSESTVLEILQTSDLHTDEELKQKAAQFINDRFPKIEVSSEWSSLMDSNIRLASYVLRFVSTKRFSDN